MRNDASCFDIGVGFRHHFLKCWVGFDLFKAIFHIGIKLDGFAYYHAAVPRVVKRQFFEQFVGALVEYKLVSQGESPHGPD